MSSSATMITMPANSAANPIWTTRRGEASGKTLGTPTAASSKVTDSGSSRTPVATADSPSATDRNSGTVKNRPACSRYWNRNESSPPPRGRVRPRRRAHKPRGPAGRRANPPPHEAPNPPPAGQAQPDDWRHPQPLGCALFGLDKAPRPRAQDAIDDQPQAQRGQHGAHRV